MNWPRVGLVDMESWEPFEKRQIGTNKVKLMAQDLVEYNIRNFSIDLQVLLPPFIWTEAKFIGRSLNC